MKQTNSQLMDDTSSAARKAGKPFGRMQVALVAQNVMAIHREFVAVLTKLDGSGATDADYASTLAPVNVKDTLTKFNALLTKLDVDLLVTGQNYVSLCKAFTEEQLPAQYDKLLKKLSTDAGVNLSTFTANAAYTVPTLND